MKKTLRLAIILVVALVLSSFAFAAEMPGLNLLTGTTEVQTFDNLSSLPAFISNAELTASPFAGESGQVLHANLVATYSTIGFKFNPALDKDRPYRISFKIYKKADAGYGTESTQLWIMKNGTQSWQIAKQIGGLNPNNPSGWYNHDYIVTTFNSLTNKDTGAIDTTDINSILIEWKYDTSSTCLNNENVYVDDVSIIPAYKFTYLDEDGTEIKTTYENTTASTFAPILTADDMKKGISGWSVKNDGTVDDLITLKNEDVVLYAIYDNTLKINLSSDKTLLTSAGDKANLSTNLWHRNGVDGISVSYSIAEGASFVTLKDNGNGTATVTAKAEGLAKILCTASTGESEYMYILCDYQTITTENKEQTVPTISASEWLYDHTGAKFNSTENAWEVVKRTDVVKSDDGKGNIVYYNNGFLSKQTSVDTSKYKYLLFRVKSNYSTSFQVAVRVGSTYKYAYPSTSATNGQYVDMYADLNALAKQAGNSTITQFVLGITNCQNKTVYIKDITLSSIPTYESQVPEVQSLKVTKKVSSISEDSASVEVEAAIFSNKSTRGAIAWKSSSECVAIKNLGNGKASLKAMGDGTATITAYAESDESISESFTVTVSGQREKQSVYDLRILFWGASTTKHTPNASLGWYGNWGMAASAEENDYVHKLVSYLEEEFYPSKVTFEVIAASTLDVDLTSCTDANKDWTNHVQYREIEETIKQLKPNIIVTAMTGNMGADTSVEVAYNAYKQFYDMMYSYGPDTIIIAQHCGLSCKVRNDKVIEQLDKDYSDKVFFDYHVNPTMKLDPANLAPEFEHSGVAAHWGDKGHNLVATTCFNLLKPEIPANIQAEYIYIPEKLEIKGESEIASKGSAVQLTVTATPGDASTDVVWTVNNSNIASINQNGLLTAINNGTVIVTATSSYNSEVKATHTVVVKNQLENFTLKYDAGTDDAVSGLPAADEYASGVYTLSSAMPLRDKYNFIGWGLTKDAKETVKTVEMTGNITVYAIWQKVEGYEFDGEYDENNGYLYGFSIDGGFHANVSKGSIWSTCTAGAKVTFKSPLLDIVNKNFASFGLISTYTDDGATIEFTVYTDSETKKYVYPLTSTSYTTYYADLSDVNGTITGFEVYINAVPEDKSMFNIGLDYVRFTGSHWLDSEETQFVITDGNVYVSSLPYASYTVLPTSVEKDNAYILTFKSGYSAYIENCEGIYVKSSDATFITLNKLAYNSLRLYGNSKTLVFDINGSSVTENEDFSSAITSYDEASLRAQNPNGLRAKASVPKTFSHNDDIKEYGFAVALRTSIDSGKILDVILKDEYLKAKSVIFGAAYKEDTNTHKVFDSDDDTEFFTAVLYNIPMTKSALTTKLVFRPYVKLGDSSILYGAKIEKTVYEVAIDVFYSANYDELTKAKAKEIIDICGDPLDNELEIDVDNLYKD